MASDVTENYELFLRIRAGENAIEFFLIDTIGYCVFDRYEDGADGFEQRQQIRQMVPNLYDDLRDVVTLDDFAAIVARVRVGLSVGGS